MGEFTRTEHLDGRVTLYGGDSRDILKQLPDNSIDSVVTDPPYALVSIQKRFGGANAKPTRDGDVYSRSSAGFMGKNWDTGETAFAVEFWYEVYRVLKPGGHVVAFSGTRTYHRMACAIEDAGFEIRDQCKWMHEDDSERDAFLASLNDEQRAQFVKLFEEHGAGQLSWTYGSGFPKSHDVSKDLDKRAGFWRGKAGAIKKETVGQPAKGTEYERADKGDPITDAARQWQGWGTALKPSWEPICLGRKPLIGTVAENVLAHGTGALNIDATRVGSEGGTRFPRAADKSETASVGGYLNAKAGAPIDAGRWPANLCHDGSDEVVAAFPQAPGQQRYTGPEYGSKDSVNVYGFYGPVKAAHPRDNGGSAARFFYTAKADKLDRIGSKHPTVKPVDLMQWLCRLVTPPGGVVLDPFAGSGSTGEAAWREGFRCVLIEREEEYQADIAERLRLANAGPSTRRAKAVKQVANDNLPLFGGAEAETGGGRGEKLNMWRQWDKNAGRK